MDKNWQLEYCKKCTKQSFTVDKGIVCGLTGVKAEFEEECGHFEMDNARVKAISSRQADEGRGRYSFGFSPKKVDSLLVTDLTKKQSLVLAIEAAKRLGWNIGHTCETGFTAYTSISMLSWSEEVKVRINVGSISIKSECTGSQIFDWGKNRKNIKLFISAFNEVRRGLEWLDIDEMYATISSSFVADVDAELVTPLDS